MPKGKERRVRLPSERFDYTPMPGRHPWKLPGGARSGGRAVVGVGGGHVGRAVPRQYLSAPQGVSTVPDGPTWAWHDYGMRVGFWRLHEALPKRKIPATTAINAN